MPIITKAQFGCIHYKRNCLVLCNKCNRSYPCRICHDKIEAHSLIRFEITRMMCLFCGSTQKKSNKCVGCKHLMAEYFCIHCSLWTESRNIFHCKKCGICRSGDIGSFEHCDKCEACIEIGTSIHKHASGGMKNNCPICAEYMLDSTKQAVLLRCGHTMHQECYKANLINSIHCPLCFKLVGDDKEIRRMIRMMAESNKHEKPQIDILGGYVSCFECGGNEYTTNYSLFNECEKCGSYNTKMRNNL